jgi:4-aminobutyrate aminotransferase-like enzyme
MALPAGADGRVLELLPPAVLTRRQLAVALAALRRTAPAG